MLEVFPALCLAGAEAAVTPERAADVQAVAGEVDILPLDSENLAEPERLVQRDDDDRLEPRERRAVGEQAPLLVARENPSASLALPRSLTLAELPRRVDADRAELCSPASWSDLGRAGRMPR